MSLPDWFEGAIDLHVHSRPSIFPRLSSDREVVAQAARAGMRAVVLKAHEGSTVERAAIAAAALTGSHEEEEGSGGRSDGGRGAGGTPAPFTVKGGIVLNHFVGGLNPVAVELALALGGGIVWFPTIHADNHVDYYGEAGFKEQRTAYQPRAVRPLRVLDENGTLLQEAREVLEVVASHPGSVLNNGHLDAPSTAVLFREAKALGIEKLMVAHPELPLTGYSLDFQQEMVRLGAVIERCYLPHTERWGAFPMERTAREISRLGAQHCVLSTDLGQADGPPPVEGLALFGTALIEHGLSVADIETMLKRNAAYLLDID